MLEVEVVNVVSVVSSTVVSIKSDTLVVSIGFTVADSIVVSGTETFVLVDISTAVGLLLIF